LSTERCGTDVDDLIRVFDSSSIVRPTTNRERIAKMFSNANLVLSAWDEGRLVGVGRALTDYSYCCYLSDLAVDREYQRSGIGKKLIELVREDMGSEVALILLSAAGAMPYYSKVGFEKFENGFVTSATSPAVRVRV
jgi:predicted N-acetyltransferase YhbS